MAVYVVIFALLVTSGLVLSDSNEDSEVNSSLDFPKENRDENKSVILIDESSGDKKDDQILNANVEHPPPELEPKNSEIDDSENPFV